MKKTKIICTIGPASMSKKTIKSMYNNGMNAARINLSHGDFKQYEKIINNVRSVCNIPIILDTQGPEVRTVNQHVVFKKGDEIRVGLSANIYKKLKTGIKILLNDGLDSGVIKKIEKKSIIIKMSNKGELENNRSIIFRNTNIQLPILTKKDEQAMRFAKKQKVDYVALSYTRNVKDVEYVKKKLKGSGIRIIAKIENMEGVKNFGKIIKSCHGAMVARGDLGVELASEKVPMIQKRLIKECNLVGEPVIVATQMMESMIKHKNPTRAETSDVANAILDGADCLMLSGETSIGEHPSLVVKKMTRICKNTEKLAERQELESYYTDVEDTITNNAFHVAEKLGGQIICMSRTGHTARMLSRFKPEKHIIAITPDEQVERQLMISYAVRPVFYKQMKEYDTKEMDNTTRMCLRKKLVRPEDLIVFVAGFFIKKTTNTITVFRAKDLAK